VLKVKGKTSTQKGLFCLLIAMLVFQNPLESVHPLCSYIDELVALLGACYGLYDIVVIRKCHPTKEQLCVGVPLLLFISVGLAGNLLFRYQPLKSVIIDLFTNLKFFFAIGTGYYLFRKLQWQEKRSAVCWTAKIITLFLFVLFIADRIFNIWPNEVRYGIANTKLFYFHCTYLAAAMAFLIALMTVFYDKKNLPFIGLCLIIMMFTLRAKAFASAAAYVAMFVFFIVWKKELKLWHVGALGAGSIAIAWNNIRYYFVELAGESARSVMTSTSLRIMKDYFPIGTGFGTYGSAEAEKYYSPVYIKYGFNNHLQLRDVKDAENIMRIVMEVQPDGTQEEIDQLIEFLMNYPTFLTDTFWPIIFGQTGFLGTIAYVAALIAVLVRCLKVKKQSVYAYVGVLFAMVYLIISSMAEPAFHNSLAMGLAFVVGMVFQQQDCETVEPDVLSVGIE